MQVCEGASSEKVQRVEGARKYAEERQDTLNYLKTSFMHNLERAHSD